MEMLAGAPPHGGTDDLKALIDEKSAIRADCRMGAQRETGASSPAPFDLS